VIWARRPAVDAVAAVLVLSACGYAMLELGRPPWWQWVVTLGAAFAASASGVIPAYASAVLCAAVALTQYSVAARLPPARSLPVLAVGLGLAGSFLLWWPAAVLVANIERRSGRRHAHDRHDRRSGPAAGARFPVV